MNLEGLGRDVWVGQLASLLDARDVCALAQSCRALHDVAALLWPVLLWRDYGLREGGRERYRELRATGVWRNPAWYPSVVDLPPNTSREVKLVFTGATESGKTAIVEKVSHGGVHLFGSPCGPVRASTGGMVVLRVWDLATSEGYARLRAVSWPDTEVAAVCFSVCLAHRKRSSAQWRKLFAPTAPWLDSMHGTDFLVKAWVHELRQYVPDARIVLIGSLCTDRSSPHSHDLLPFGMGVCLAREVNAYAYVEVNAATGVGVDKIFPLAVEAVLAGDKPAPEPQTTTKCALM